MPRRRLLPQVTEALDEAPAAALPGHSVSGGIWEGFAIESLIAAAPEGTEAHSFRTSARASRDCCQIEPATDWLMVLERMPGPHNNHLFLEQPIPNDIAACTEANR